jgi:hypothetical protein
MPKQTTRLEEKALPRELSEMDLEPIAAGKDGDYGWFSITSGKESRRLAQLHPSPPTIP